MSDRPIIFSPPMVRALIRETEHPLLGKTETRRLPSPQNVLIDGRPVGTNPAIGKSMRWIFDTLDWSRAYIDAGPSPAGNPGPYWKVPCSAPEAGGTVHRIYPKWQVGDRLWVREGWHLNGGQITYMADHPGDPKGLGWAPSIHIRREHSRLTLLVTQVRCQQLREITAVEAEREGIERIDRAGETSGPWWRDYLDRDRRLKSTRLSFATLWVSTHGEGAWKPAQPVVAISFTVHRCNIDAMPRAEAA